LENEKDIQYFIVKGLFENKQYFRDVSNNLDPTYFDPDKAPIVKYLSEYFSKYEDLPDYSVVLNDLTSSKDISEDLKEHLEEAIADVKALDFNSREKGEWLFDNTRTFVDERAVASVLRNGVGELKKDPKDRDLAKIQQQMREALSMNWNDDLGIDYFSSDDFDERYALLSDVTTKIPLGVPVIDAAINGGIPGRTKFCCVLIGSSGLGKTLILSNLAVNAVKSGKNVLYISFELSREILANRIDACFTDLSVSSTIELKADVKQRIADAKKNNGAGRFFIMEFPPASVSALDIESYINTLNIKKEFKPDIIVLDYLGIMKPITKEAKNSYEKGKAVCEEIRALSDRIKAPILTAAQTNRSDYNTTDVNMDNIADSMGIAHTSDLIISLAQDDDLKELNQIKFEIIKSRISKTGTRGIVEIDFDRMKVLTGDVNEEENSDLEYSINSSLKAISDENDNEIT